MAILDQLATSLKPAKLVVNGDYRAASSDAVQAAISETFSAIGFENMPWSRISQICKAGQAATYFKVGDQKNINCGGVIYTISIIGIDHDDVYNSSTYGRTKAGITCQVEACWQDRSNMVPQLESANIWTSSVMRQTTLPNILTKLPSDLQSVIVNVNKKTMSGNQSTTIGNNSEKLFLLSRVEIDGTTETGYSGEGTRYAWYAAANVKFKMVRPLNILHAWWLRSPVVGANNKFLQVTTTEVINDNYGHNQLGVAFAFCV